MLLGRNTGRKKKNALKRKVKNRTIDIYDATSENKPNILEFFPSSDEKSEDGEKAEDILESNVFLNISSSSEKWHLPSDQTVDEIFSTNVSSHIEVTKNKKKLTPVDKAILRYGASKLIDLLSKMNGWFTLDQMNFMINDHKKSIILLDLPEEIKIFISETYKYCIEEHSNSELGSDLYLVSKVYLDFLYETLDGSDMLGRDYTECDIIIKLQVNKSH
nr:236_t:CDS:2 [Entrophospora candida]